jgi:CheY-like chemotaxis protein
MAKVLVIDDEPSIASLVSEIIESYGHEVCLAFNGQQGLDLIKQQYFNLIISDIMMPHLTGRELLNFVRSQPALARTRFILMSAVAHLSRLESKYQPDAFLVKPFDITQIDELVETYLPEPENKERTEKSIPVAFPMDSHYNSSYWRHSGQ